MGLNRRELMESLMFRWNIFVRRDFRLKVRSPFQPHLLRQIGTYRDSLKLQISKLN